MANIKNIKFTFILFFFCSFSSYSQESDKGSRLEIDESLIKEYKSMVMYNYKRSVESYFSANFISEMKKVFKKKCGYKCILGFSDQWIDEYDNFMNFDFFRRDRYVLFFWKIIILSPEIKILSVKKAGCNGGRDSEELTYVKEGSAWLIDRFLYNEWRNNELELMAAKELDSICRTGKHGTIDLNKKVFIEQ